jgi:hypothetical protein
VLLLLGVDDEPLCACSASRLFRSAFARALRAFFALFFSLFFSVAGSSSSSSLAGGRCAWGMGSVPAGWLDAACELAPPVALGWDCAAEAARSSEPCRQVRVAECASQLGGCQCFLRASEDREADIRLWVT